MKRIQTARKNEVPRKLTVFETVITPTLTDIKRLALSGKERNRGYKRGGFEGDSGGLSNGGGCLDFAGYSG